MSEALRLAEDLRRQFMNDDHNFDTMIEASIELRRLSEELENVRKDAGRWRTFLSTRPQATHEVINQAIDDAAMKGTP